MAGPPVVVYADGPDGPLPDPARFAPGGGDEVSVVLGWVVRTPDWLEEGRTVAEGVTLTTLLTGAGVRRAVAQGRVRSVPTRLSAVPGLLTGRLRPDVAVVGATRAGDGWRLVGSPGWAEAAVRAARSVVVEEWPERPGLPPVGAWLPPCEVVSVIARTDPPDAPPVNHTSPVHRAIGDLVAGLVPDGATLQWGPGAVGAAVVAALDRPVRVRSGLVTDELVDLDRRGLLLAPAEAAYLWGGPGLAAMAGDGRLALRPVGWTHDLTAISATERFVAVNTALQVSLDGSANVETAGGRVVTGPGGHPDFSAGASRSPGGLSVIALPSTAAGRSTIVAAVETVSTPRCDVDVVVTEHGVADLRGATPAERAARLVSVAAPEFRAGLAGS